MSIEATDAQIAQGYGDRMYLNSVRVSDCEYRNADECFQASEVLT